MICPPFNAFIVSLADLTWYVCGHAELPAEKFFSVRQLRPASKPLDRESKKYASLGASGSALPGRNAACFMPRNSFQRQVKPFSHGQIDGLERNEIVVFHRDTRLYRPTVLLPPMVGQARTSFRG